MPEDSFSPSAAISPVAGSPRERFEELRRRHPRLICDAFQGEPHRESNGVRVKFDYRLEVWGGDPDIEFSPRTVIESLDWERLKLIPTEIQENCYFHLGLIESLSYWKAACAAEIVVERPEDVLACALDPEQIAWWSNLLRKGMGEYFYVNQIDFRAADLVRITASPREDLWRLNAYLRDGDKVFGTFQHPQSESPIPSRESRDLVLTSGGKDSVVTLELLKAAGRKFDCLLLNPTQAALDIAKQAGCEQMIIVRRTIDPRLLEFNAAGYLNGHTPFSALLAFLGVTVAVLFGHRRVIVSNERSAEEATVEYLGEPINHQYSKTFEFETAFRQYSNKYLSPDIEYFSMLRPLYEIQIARLFANYPQYFSIFRSCNRGQATNSWCGRCPKCLFVWTVLYPFVERGKMLSIFGSDLYAWESSVIVLRELLGLDATKPFECVGTKEETLAAIHLCVEKYKQEGIPLPPSLTAIQQTLLASRNDHPALAQRILASWSDQNYLPAEISSMLRPSEDRGMGQR